MGVYFASDGNYGPAEGMTIVDTTWWSDDNWQEIAEASDDARAEVALAIARAQRGVKE